MSDSNTERFHRVAAARTAKVITTLRLLGNCADLRSYRFTPDEANALLAQVESALAEVKEQFVNPLPCKGPRFALKERNDKQ